MKLISIIIPAFNEEGNVKELSNRIKNVFKTINNYDYEIIFVENGSTDNTFNTLKDIQICDILQKKMLEMTRDFLN